MPTAPKRPAGARHPGKGSQAVQQDAPSGTQQHQARAASERKPLFITNPQLFLRYVGVVDNSAHTHIDGVETNTAHRAAETRQPLFRGWGFRIGLESASDYIDFARHVEDALRTVQAMVAENYSIDGQWALQQKGLGKIKGAIDAIEPDPITRSAEADALSEIVIEAFAVVELPIAAAEKAAKLGKLASQAAAIAESLKHLHSDPRSAYEELGRTSVTEEATRPSEQETRRPRPISRQAGYVQPNRANKKMLGVHVDANLLNAFRAAVEAEGSTIQDKVTAFMLDTVSKTSSPNTSASRKTDMPDQRKARQKPPASLKT